MRTGSSFSKQAPRSTELSLSDLVSSGVGIRMSRTMSSLVVCNRPLPASSWIFERKGGLCEGWNAKNSGGRTDGRPIEM